MNLRTINLHVQPKQVPLSWEAFCQTSTSNSVALDGYVFGGPRWDIPGKRVNFNHHENVDRLGTRATCAQVLMAMRQGLDRFLKYHGKYHADVFVNDCDEDVCTSVWMMDNPHLITSTMNPRLNRLVFVEDMLDTTAGAYPFPDELPLLAELAWVYEPYRSFRKAGRLGVRDAREFRNIIEDVGRRIEAHLMGSGRSIALETNYELVVHGSNWVMVKNCGQHYRTSLFSQGVRAFVEVRPREDGITYDYTVGRMAPFVDFPLPEVLNALNAAEHISESNDRWGGSDVIAGSPRINGSTLPPLEVVRLIQQTVNV